MIRICAYVKLYALHNKSGGELYLHHLLKEFKKNIECEIDVFCYDSENLNKYEMIEYYDDIRIINLNKDDKRNLNNYDLVFTQLDLTKSVCDYCLHCNKKCILVIHSYYKTYLDYTKNDKIFTIYNAPLIKSEYKMNNHTNNFNCVILPFFNFELYNQFFTQNLEEREYITFVNPSRQKGADIVLQIAKNEKNRKFLIVQGGYYPHNQLIKEFKQLPNCHVIGQTDNMLNDVYLKSRIVLMPSEFETWGMVASEAASLGIPVLIAKSSNGLIANMSKLCLGSINQNVNDYIKYIKMLDDKNIYGIYSFYMVNVCEKNYNKRKEQLDLLFNNWDYIFNKL